MSVTSFILGILSIVGCLFLAGIPAILTGHWARARIRRDPARYGGSALAKAGLILGYLGTILVTLVVGICAAFILPEIARQKAGQNQQWGGPQGNWGGPPMNSACVNNLKQIGLAARVWAIDHQDVFPPNFAALTNELPHPKVLVCPDDRTKTAAPDWAGFEAAKHVTYEFLHPATKEEDLMDKPVFRCPVHNNVGYGDGSVQPAGGMRQR